MTDTTATDRRELIARAIFEARGHSRGTSDGMPIAWDYAKEAFKSSQSVSEAYSGADAVLAALKPWLLPDIPEGIKRVTINTNYWRVEFYVGAFPNDNGEIWQDLEGDYEGAKLSVAASVCEIPGASKWDEWDCYPNDGGWIVFADNDGEDGHPAGEGGSIAAAIRAALNGETR
jgi:hypothetical protein